MNGEKEGLKAVGSDVAGYEAKIAWLKKKWPRDSRDSTAFRVIGPVLHVSAAHICLSVMADNVKYFDSHFNSQEIDPMSLLGLACLSGSKQVAESLMDKCQLNYLSPDCDFLLGLVCASPNIQWAKEIALTLAKADKEIPSNVSLFTDNLPLVIEIQQIFKTKSMPTPEMKY